MQYDLIEGTAPSTINEILTGYIREQASRSIYHLQKDEGASEVLVGFLTELSPQDDELLNSKSGASRQERTETLRSTQQQYDVKQLAAETVGPVKPARTETNIPGIQRVERDLSRVQGQQVEWSWLANVVRLTATPSMIRKLAQAKEVAFVIPNFETTLPRGVALTQADLRPIQQLENKQEHTWNISYLKVPKLWEQGLTGKGVRIGHLDTGVDASHPDLMGKIERFALFDPRGSEVKSSAFDSSMDGHGTHTAGIMVGGDSSGINIGVAPEAQLISALVLMNGATNAFNVIKGIEWICDQGVKVLNLSLGGSGYNATYEFLMQQVISLEILPSCSVGNDGLAVTESPGNLALAFGIGAIDHKERVPRFSGGGSVSWYDEDGHLVPINNPDLVAPGVAIRSSLPRCQWDHRTGTSMAAPHVSGVIALLAQAEPSASLTELVDAIKSTTHHPKTTSRPPVPDSRFGLGIIDPIRALEKLKARPAH